MLLNNYKRKSILLRHLHHCVLVFCVLVYAGCGNDNGGKNAVVKNTEEKMIKLVIDLQRGFINSDVTVKIDDTIIFSDENITTKLLQGKAGSFFTYLSAETEMFELRVKINDAVENFPLNADSDTYIGISLDKNKINITVSDEPFGYM